MTNYLQDFIRGLAGIVRPEMREIAQKIAEQLPEVIRKPFVGRAIGFIAQIIEKKNLGGFQEAISDAIEIIADEIGKQTGKGKEKTKAELGVEEIKSSLLRQFEQSRKRIEQAEQIKESTAREKEILEAQEELIKSYLQAIETIDKKIREITPETEPRKEINWDKIFNRIDAKMQEKISGIDEKAKEAAKSIKRLRRRIRRGGLFPR